MARTVLTILILSWVSLLAAAQFNFFDQMFGGHQQQQHHQQQRPSGAAYYAAQADSVPCSQYLCPGTLTCVDRPSECPCPDVQDVKCVIPDPLEKGASTVVCVRGQQGCAEVEKLSKSMGK